MGPYMKGSAPLRRFSHARQPLEISIIYSRRPFPLISLSHSLITGNLLQTNIFHHV